MKWYDFVSLGGFIITVIGFVVFLSAATFERNSLGVLILLFGIVIITFGYVVRAFNQIQKKGKHTRPLT